MNKKYLLLALSPVMAMTLAVSAGGLTASAQTTDDVVLSRQLAQTPPPAGPNTQKKGLQQAGDYSKTMAEGAGITSNPSRTLPQIIGLILRSFLGLLGTVFVVLTIYAGFLWMTAQGNEEQVTKAKKLITNAVIGIIITVFAYAITGFVLDALIRVTSSG